MRTTEFRRHQELETSNHDEGKAPAYHQTAGRGSLDWTPREAHRVHREPGLALACPL